MGKHRNYHVTLCNAGFIVLLILSWVGLWLRDSRPERASLVYSFAWAACAVAFFVVLAFTGWHWKHTDGSAALPKKGSLSDAILQKVYVVMPWRRKKDAPPDSA